VLQACDHALCIQRLVRGKKNRHTHIGSDLCSFRIKPFERVQIVERDRVKSNPSLYEKKKIRIVERNGVGKGKI